eukprot:782500-Alexandrium_andersonii.AAC.1
MSTIPNRGLGRPPRSGRLRAKCAESAALPSPKPRMTSHPAAEAGSLTKTAAPNCSEVNVVER